MLILNKEDFMKDLKIENVVGYFRVSTEEQANNYSIDGQKTEVRRYCNGLGYNLLEEYTDKGITGTSIDKREDFKRMLRDIGKNKNIDAIVIYKLSRISRRMIDLLDTLEFLENHNVALISISDGVNTLSTMGKTIIKLVGVFAEMERDNIVEQAKNGLKERARQGLWNGGPSPLGYDNNKDGKGLVINGDEAETVRLIFDLYTNKNWGYSKICQQLNRNLDKHATKNGKAWAYSTIKQILDNPIYNGYIRWGKQENWNSQRRNGTTTDFILEKGIHEPIIDKDLWEKTQAKRLAVGKTPEKIKHFTYLLSGLAKCPQCGSAMVAARAQKKDKEGNKKYYRYYNCSYWNTHKGNVCRPNSIRAEVLEEQVIEVVRNFINSPNIIEELMKRMGDKIDIKEIESSMKSKEKQLKKLKADQNTYYGYLTDADKIKKLSEDKLFEIISNIDSQIESLQADLSELNIKKNSLSEEALNYENIAMMLKNFDKVFELASDEQKKDLFHSLIKEIKINPSENIWERKASEIVLWFDNTDIMAYTQKDNNGKKFDVIYGTVPR